MKNIASFVRVGLCFLVMSAVLSGCFLKPSPPPEYYLLPSPAKEAPAGLSTLNGVRLAVGPVTIPGYLDHLSMLVRRPDAGMVYLTTKAQWSEPLRSGVTRVLCDVLSQRLASRGGAAFPLDSDMQADWRLYVNVMRFDGAPDAPVVLEADWGLTTPFGEVRRMGHFSDTVKAGPELAGMVGAMSSLLERFATSLGGELGRLSAAGGAAARRARHD